MLTEDYEDRGRTMPVTVAGLVADLAELPSLMLSTDSLDEVVWQAAMLAVHAIDEVEACGVTVLREGSPVSILPGVAPYGELEQRQYEFDDGPLVQTLKTRDVVVVSSMGSEGRWGGYPAVAAERGVAASICLPLLAGDQILGAITLYANQDCDFAAGRRLAELVTELAATALCCMRAHAEKTELSDQLRQALESRAVIEQAKGVLMARHGCGADAAFNLLRRSSQNRNVKLREVAAIVMDTLALS